MQPHSGIGHVAQPRFNPSRTSLVSIVWALLGGLATASPAVAQTPVAQSRPWDTVFVAGLLGGRPNIDDRNSYRDAWFDTAQAGIIVGRHLSTNLKLELELATAAEGRQYIQRSVTIPNVPYPVPYGTERFTTLRQASGTVVWQFLDNEWVHPFVQAGIAADFERVRTRVPAQIFYVGDPRLPGSRVITEEHVEGPDTTTTMAVVLGGGAKIYATPRVFLRTDGRVTGDGKRHSVAFRLGLGVDF